MSDWDRVSRDQQGKRFFKSRTEREMERYRPTDEELKARDKAHWQREYEHMAARNRRFDERWDAAMRWDGDVQKFRLEEKAMGSIDNDEIRVGDVYRVDVKVISILHGDNVEIAALCGDYAQGVRTVDLKRQTRVSRGPAPEKPVVVGSICIDRKNPNRRIRVIAVHGDKLWCAPVEGGDPWTYDKFEWRVE